MFVPVAWETQCVTFVIVVGEAQCVVLVIADEYLMFVLVAWVTHCATFVVSADGPVLTHTLLSSPVTHLMCYCSFVVVGSFEKVPSQQLTQCVKCCGPLTQYCIKCNIYLGQPLNPPPLLPLGNTSLRASQGSLPDGVSVMASQDDSFQRASVVASQDSSSDRASVRASQANSSDGISLMAFQDNSSLRACLMASQDNSMSHGGSPVASHGNSVVEKPIIVNIANTQTERSQPHQVISVQVLEVFYLFLLFCLFASFFIIVCDGVEW